jgi:hypothetical protein
VAAIDDTDCEIVREGFCGMWNEFEAALRRVPLSLINESVLRWFYVNALLQKRPDVMVQIEWHKMDLLIQETLRNHLVEFKFFTYPQRLGLKGGSPKLKGHSSQRNRDDFFKDVIKFANAGTDAWLSAHEESGQIHSKSLILVYSHHSRFERWKWDYRRIYSIEALESVSFEGFSLKCISDPPERRAECSRSEHQLSGTIFSVAMAVS